MADTTGLRADDRDLLAVPMFHANGWGHPYAAALVAMTLILPGPFRSAEPLARLIAMERPTVMAAVPTIYADLLRHADEHGCDLGSLRVAVCGGAAMPPALAQAFEQRHGVRLLHAWGMTETSPMGTISAPPSELDVEEQWRLRIRQGPAVPFVELRITDAAGAELPWDGVATGELEARGPWVASAYYKDAAPEQFHDGWLRTGDIANIDSRGYVEITDRAKDMINSGGEWISSVALENALLSHPSVHEAAVIAVPDERWGERPQARVVLGAGAAASAEQLRAHLAPHFPKWWLPDEFVFVDALPKTSVGKLDKKRLRAEHGTALSGGAGAPRRGERERRGGVAASGGEGEQRHQQ